MTDIDVGKKVEELEKLAKEATPGPWCWESVAEKSNEFVVGIACDKDGTTLTGCVNDQHYDEDTQAWVEDEIIRRTEIGANETGHANFADAAYIAALSPDVCLVLCAELKKVRELWDMTRKRLGLSATYYDTPEKIAEATYTRILHCDDLADSLASSEKLVDELVEGLELAATRLSASFHTENTIACDVWAKEATALLSRVKGGVK